MYVNPFIVGVFVTLLTEILLLIVYAATKGGK